MSPGTNNNISGGGIEIVATDTSTSMPDIGQINIGLLTVGTINATPSISRDTQAYVDQQASIDAGTNDILLEANSTSTIDSTVASASIGLVDD